MNTPNDIEPKTDLKNTNPQSSHKSFGILLPSGELLGGDCTRKEAMDALVFMPHGSRIHPPIPGGNRMAMNFLDYLCDSELAINQD